MKFKKNNTEYSTMMKNKVKLDVSGAQHSVRAALCCHLANATDLLTPVLRLLPVGGSKLRSYFSPFVDQSSPDYVSRRGIDRSLQRRFPIVDVLFHSGDIRDRSAKSSEMALKCLPAPFFLGGGLPNFGSSFLKLHPFPIMWQRFAAISRETAENSRWRKKERNSCET